MRCNLQSSPSCHMRSNALLISQNITRASFFLPVLHTLNDTPVQVVESHGMKKGDILQAHKN